MSAQFFNNEDFSGPAVKRVDPKVDFEWDNDNPAEGISFENFSVKWSGYIRVPVTGKYKFSFYIDDGAELRLNGQTIIKHFMGSEQTNTWLDASKGNIRENLAFGTIESTSKPVNN